MEFNKHHPQNPREIRDTEIPNCCSSCSHKGWCAIDVISHPFMVCDSYDRALIYSLDVFPTETHG